MSNRSLVICDQEPAYGAAFAAFLQKKKELDLQVQVCVSLAQVKAFSKEHGVDILLLSEGYSEEERKDVEAGCVCMLTESAVKKPTELAVYKYQSAQNILAELVTKCSAELGREELFPVTGVSHQVKILGVFSPLHRCGKTTYALRLGREMALSANVLYLSLELYGGVGGHFPQGGQTLADLLYYARQEKRNLGLVLTTMVQHTDGLDYLLPVRMSEDIRSVEVSEWISLIGQIASQSIYDVVILDIDEGIKGLYEVLKLCTEIHLPTAQDEAARSKLQQFEEELHILGCEEISQKIQRKEKLL